MNNYPYFPFEAECEFLKQKTTRLVLINWLDVFLNKNQFPAIGDLDLISTFSKTGK